MKVILISGKARHGKDTLATMLQVKLADRGKRAKITHFGDLLKYVCKEFFDWDGNKDEAGRSLLQYVGTDLIRKKDPNFWCRFIYEMCQYTDKYDYMIVADTRFMSEINQFPEACKIRIGRIFKPYELYELNNAQSRHRSETELDNYNRWDYHIVVESDDLEYIYRKASEIVKEIEGDK